MTRGRRARWWATVAFLVSVLGTTTRAHADERLVCANASEAGQKLRDEGKLLKARHEFLSCARDVCPGVIKKDCADWLAATDASLPSVVLAAKDARGDDVETVRVTIDGHTSEEKLDGKAMVLDPGPHTFRFEIPEEAPIDQQIVVREGEKNRSVAVSWKRPTLLKPGESSSEPDWKQKHLPALVVGAAGVVVLGVGTALVLVDAGQYGDLKDTCGQTRTCTDDQISPVRTKLVLGDIAIGVGVVAIGTAVVLYYLESRPTTMPTQIGAVPSVKPKTGLGKLLGAATVDFVPTTGGGTATFGARF